MKSTKLTTGIICRIYNAVSADKVLVLIDKNGSKVPILAKGARKPTSRKASSIELGNLVSCKIVEGYSIPILSEIKAIAEFRHWKETFESSLLLQLMCEAILGFIVEDDKIPHIHELLITTLSQQEKHMQSVAIFLEKILLVTGNLPKLNECVQTSKSLPQDKDFYVAANSVGYVAEKNLGSANYNPRIYKTQRYIEHKTFEDSIRINLTENEQKNMLKLHIDWIEFALEKELKSKKVVLSLL